MEKQITYRSTVNPNPNKKRWTVNIISATILLLLIYVVLGGDFSKDIFKTILGMNYRQFLTIFISILYTIILAVSLNLSTGCLGEMVLGHAGFMAVGAYAGSLYLKYSGAMADDNFATIVAILIGFVAAGIVGFLVGIPVLRLRGDYLAIITLGFGQIISTIIKLLNFDGSGKLTGIPLNRNVMLYAIVVIIVVTVIFTFMKSRHGRAILAIREDDIAAEACGIPVTKYKVGTFTFSAALAGIAGVLFAQNIGVLQPIKFEFNYSIEILVIVVLGGLGSFTGSIVATIILLLLPEMLRFLQDYRLIIYSSLLIIIMLTKPNGILGRYEFSAYSSYKKIVKFFKNLPANLKAFPSNFKKGMVKVKEFFKHFRKNMLKIFRKMGKNVKTFFNRGGSSDE
ncbi:MAG: branched-chain amino acid ABC transporter permease [Bacilli bacterium]|nr:branched-chain amino acid ABC transporter permease [Bacilli bacterium]